VIATPAETIPGLIAELGQRGTKTAVVLTAGPFARIGSGKKDDQPALAASATRCAMPLRDIGHRCDHFT
jgi:acetyltransferase